MSDAAGVMPTDDEPPSKRQCVEDGTDKAAVPAADAAEPAAAAPEAAPDGLGGGTLIVRPLPKHWDVTALRNLLSGSGVKYVSLRKQKSWQYAFITFGFLADRVHAEAALPKLRVEGRALKAADASPRGGGGKPAAERDATADATTRAARDVRDAVCPLWAVPYAEQLTRKRATVEAALTQLSKSTRKMSHGKPPQWTLGGGAACPLRGIVRSPVLQGYRNKCEFSIGPGDTGLATVGFNVGSFAEGYAAVASGERCLHVSPAARQLAAWMQAHLRDASALPFWDKRRSGGFWRLLTVREGGMALCSGAGWRKWLVADPAAGAAQGMEAAADALPASWEGQPAPRNGAEVLCLVQVNPTGHAADVVRAECAALAAALRQAAAAAHPPMPLGELLLQVHTGCSNAAPADAPLMPLDDYTEAAGPRSEGALHERLFDLRFRVSPDAFFQVNTASAEALYELAGEWASCGADGDAPSEAEAASPAVLYDVCCGTGTIGLTLARRFASVVGVDICEAAVRDAAANSAANGVGNATFHAGRAEQVLPRLLREAAQGDAPPQAVAIVDPPRAGLHKTVLGALRSCGQLSRLVYVSCNVETMASDAAALCATTQGGPPPFRPVCAMAVDLFPHTKHVEGVLLLER